MSLAPVVMAGAAGYKASTQVPILKDSITQVQQETAKWQQQYSQLINQDLSLEGGLDQSMRETLQTFQELSAQLKVQQDDYTKSFRLLELVGIIIIVIIFVLLLLKQFGLLEPFGKIFFYPERWVFAKIKGQGNPGI